MQPSGKQKRKDEEVNIVSLREELLVEAKTKKNELLIGANEVENFHTSICANILF